MGGSLEERLGCVFAHDSDAFPLVNKRATLDEQCKTMPDTPDQIALRQRLAALQEEHQDLDSAIVALTSSPPFDQLQVQRLKKKKLQLRDEISRIEDLLIPDIIA